MANALWQVVAAYVFALAGGWISASLQLGAQAALRADQFRGRNASGRNILCDFAGKFGRVFLVGGVARARLPDTRFSFSSANMFITFVLLARPVISTQMRHGISAKSPLR